MTTREKIKPGDLCKYTDYSGKVVYVLCLENPVEDSGQGIYILLLDKKILTYNYFLEKVE